MNRKHIVHTSDWHVGHKNILNFCPRPYKNLDEMHRALIKNYNNNTHESTVGFFYGDMGICSSSVLKDVIDQLQGTKVLILGNHDRGMHSMYNAGFDVVLYGMTLKIQDQLMTFSHCPLRGLYREDTSKMKNSGGNWHGEFSDKHASFVTPNNGQFHGHGHIHSPNKGFSKRIEGRQIDLGVDANNYRPVQHSALESFIEKTLMSEGKND
tara:strand:- start:24097 stop:24726 length:630 start_codon:yes stop_codon:yes gene_type:complete